jgi:glucose/arabinose dehydrogenase
MKLTLHALAILLAAGIAFQTLAQQTVPFENGYPVAPSGLADQPLGPGPWTFKTGEGMDIRVVVVTRELEYPYALQFLPNGDLLVTERPGRLRILRNGVLDPKPIPGGPASHFAMKSGLVGAVHGYMTMALHPRFSENGWLYLAYTKPVGEKQTRMAVLRAKFDGHALTDSRDVFVAEEGVGGATSLAMTPDGMLWIATSGRNPQDPNTHGGKVLRLRDDGSVPPDNPFAGKPDHKPEVYTLGHRSSLGLTVHPGTGVLYLSEMGPNGGDEINVIKPGLNYGWPLVSYGRTYPGPWQSGLPRHEDYEPPIAYWMPSISISGLTFYTGDALPKWKGDLFVGGLRYGEIPGTGRLNRILMNEKMEELRREELLTELHQRIRDVKQGPDGLLYIATDEQQGAILRIEPAK